MSEPTCRACYAATLSSDELARFNAEPATSCIYLCPTHQRVIDSALEKMPVTFIKASTIHHGFHPVSFELTD